MIGFILAQILPPEASEADGEASGGSIYAKMKPKRQSRGKGLDAPETGIWLGGMR